MPRKKTAQQAGTEPSTQPVKKFKSDSSNSVKDEAVNRRSLRTRSQDENKVGGSLLTGVTKTPPKHMNEVGSSRPKRNALQVTEEKIGARETRLAVKTPSKQSILTSESQTFCPLEASVQVTPCDLSERKDKETETENLRKRKVKVSPRAEDKKARIMAAKIHHSPSSQSVEIDVNNPIASSSMKNCSVKLNSEPCLVMPAYTTAFDEEKLNGATVGQKGLPRQIPDMKQDPLFNRPVVKLISDDCVESGETFTLLTYNILAECARVQSDYSYTDNIHLGIDYRSCRIMEEIKHFDCDIVCLQEVDVDYYNKSLAKMLEMLGYDGTFLKRRGTKYPEGEATFYKTSKFRSKSHHTFCYTDLAHRDIEKVEHEDEVKNLLKCHVEREAVLLVSILTDRQSDRDIVIGNTHIAWTKFIDLALPCMQACYAMKIMDKLSNHGELPFSLCGDFNTRSTDPGYQATSEGYLNDHSIRELQKLDTIILPDGSKNSLVNLLWHAFQHPVRDIKSAYLAVQGNEPELTSVNYVMRAAVDYIWGSQLKTLAVTKVNTLHHYMPNIIYPSDHVSLQVTYSF
ncbi:uncharacterized protein [Watersipora subatra]|uniref:uncharacterized protein n=1 Tax=Watersipora subatra TaxID=2589382 RepID=UPI00355BCB9C